MGIIDTLCQLEIRIRRLPSAQEMAVISRTKGVQAGSQARGSTVLCGGCAEDCEDIDVDRKRRKWESHSLTDPDFVCHPSVTTGRIQPI